MIEDRARKMLFDGVEAAVFVCVLVGALIGFKLSGWDELLPQSETVSLGIAVGTVLALRTVRPSRIPKVEAAAQARAPRLTARPSIVSLGFGIGLLLATPLLLFFGIGSLDPLLIAPGVVTLGAGVYFIRTWHRSNRASQE